MNCAECRELLVAGLEGLLEDSQKQAVKGHLQTCAACRAELKSLQTLRQRLVSNGKMLAQSSVEDEVMNRILCEQRAKVRSAGQVESGLHFRRLIMKSSIVKLTVAAALVLAAIGGILLWTGTKSGVALADVLAKVEQVRALMYRMDTHMKTAMPGTAPSEADMQMTLLIADGYGMRMDQNVSDPATGQVLERQLYVLPEQQILLVVTPAKKQYERMKLDGVKLQEKKNESNDPRLLIRAMLGSPYQDLGKTRLDGIEVQGFQTTDVTSTDGMSSTTALWVDVKTGLPVRMDKKAKVNEQLEIEATLYDFQWDVPVSAAQFRPVIPADFTAGAADGMKAPTMTEQGAVDGLKLCVEFFGKYPESLNAVEFMKTLQSLDANPTPAMKKLKQEIDQIKSPEEKQAKRMAALAPLQSLFMFYMNLVKEKQEPVYYGKMVTPGDIAQVLLRWKTAENEYRVIFADLHAATVNADTLAKLEAGLPK
jgi:CRISPR/Cas system-associated protein endoribonuclease Cas2